MFNLKSKKSVSALLALLIAVSCLVSCQGDKGEISSAGEGSVTESSVSVENTENTENTESFEESVESSEIDDPNVHKCTPVEDYFTNVPYVGLYNADTLEAYYTENATQRLYPASQTKLVTAQVAVKYGDLNEIYYIGSELNLVKPGSSAFGLRKGMSMTLEHLLYGLLLPSGNDAAYSIAVNVARKHSGNPNLSDTEAVNYFCGLMNDFCKEIGANNSNFTNPEGWDDDNQYTTVEDLAIIMSHALKNETVAKIMATPNIKFLVHSGETFNVPNSNKLIKESSQYYNAAVIGGKTGFTDYAGICLTAAFVIDGTTYIGIADKCPDDAVRYTTVTDLIYLATDIQTFGRLGKFCINCE